MSTSTTWITSSRVAETAVINASPLIFLARAGHLDLLRRFAETVWVPEPVASEVSRRGTDDVTAQAIESTRWLVISPAPSIPAAILEWRLGAGESATLALAHADHLEATVDDLAGRKCAASLAIDRRIAADDGDPRESGHRGHASELGTRPPEARRPRNRAASTSSETLEDHPRELPFSGRTRSESFGSFKA